MAAYKNLNFFEYMYIVRKDWILGNMPYIKNELERNRMQRRAVYKLFQEKEYNCPGCK